MNYELLNCPFCGDTPWFEGDGKNWVDDRRCVQMHLRCCITMSASIGWMRARDMTERSRTQEMQSALINRWNTRFVEEQNE